MITMRDIRRKERERRKATKPTPPSITFSNITAYMTWIADNRGK